MAYRYFTDNDFSGADAFVYLQDEYFIPVYGRYGAPDARKLPAEPALEATAEENFELEKRLKAASDEVHAWTQLGEEAKENVPLKMRGTFDLQYFGDEHFRQIAIGFAGGGLLGFLKIAKDLLIQWLKNRASRSIRVKVKDVDVVIKGTMPREEIENTLEFIQNFSILNKGQLASTTSDPQKKASPPTRRKVTKQNRKRRKRH
jgi:hypothetical protein